MTRTRYDYGDLRYPHFLTCTIVEWLKLLQRPTAIQIVYDCWKYMQHEHRLKIMGYVVMPDHLHMIAQSPELPAIMQRFKSFTAKRLVESLKNADEIEVLRWLEELKPEHKAGSRHQVWQEGVHPQELTNLPMIEQKLDYAHHNPVRRGLVERVEDWPHSSARCYLHLECPIVIDKSWF